uniref:Uncharacterized protein n=1 Tax=Opuntia streptacantha TaxID=393608 RepID=A0A7C8Z861_OPUST
MVETCMYTLSYNPRFEYLRIPMPCVLVYCLPLQKECNPLERVEWVDQLYSHTACRIGGETGRGGGSLIYKSFDLKIHPSKSTLYDISDSVSDSAMARLHSRVRPQA